MLTYFGRGFILTSQATACPCETARRAQHAAVDGTVINLIVTSTDQNIRLAQEAHKRKLRAVTWALLLREQGKQKNKPQHYLRLQLAEPLQHSSVVYIDVLSLGECGMVQLAWEGSMIIHSWSFSGCEATISHPDHLKDSGINSRNVSWRCPSAPPVNQLVLQTTLTIYTGRHHEEPHGKTSSLQSGTLQMMMSYPLFTSVRPHGLGKKSCG